MANPERGEVDLVTDAKTYTLFLSTNALCSMQQRHKKTYGQILNDIAALDIIALRAMTHAVLQKHHAKEFQAEESVGTLIDTAKMKTVKDAMFELFTLNTPPDEPKKEKGSGSQNPSESAEDGTGDNSTLTAAA